MSRGRESHIGEEKKIPWWSSKKPGAQVSVGPHKPADQGLHTRGPDMH